MRRRLTTAGPRSSGTDSVAPRWGSADRTATASGAEHLPGAAEPGSTLPSSTAWRRTGGQEDSRRLALEVAEEETRLSSQQSNKRKSLQGEETCEREAEAALFFRCPTTHINYHHRR